MGNLDPSLFHCSFVPRESFFMNFKLVDMNGVAVISLPTGYDLLEAFNGTNLLEKNEKGMWVWFNMIEVLDSRC
ncbi:hypothetical protein ASD40_33345 [Paenibacillus sp. Root444D2]|nr:hypothetical protein ASD40_33345 [Paenibacillus sp. Root444D2]